MTSNPRLYIPQKSILGPSELFTKMTRRKWTTPNQEEWLKSHLADFSNAQANRTTSEFFAPIFKEWRNAWPTPDPTPDDIRQSGNVEKATHKKRAEEEVVSLITFYLMFTRRRRPNLVDSASELGSITIREEPPLEMVHEAF